jgi:ATP-dependent DNA ligase
MMLARPRALPTSFIAPCLPTKTDRLPSGGLWLHEIKHDGFRIIGEVFEVVEPDEPEAAAG